VTHDFSTHMRLMSRLLDYPDDDLPEFLREARTVWKGAAEAPGGQALLAFVAYLAGQPPLRLQEHYTQTFDLAPSRSLDLTYHRYADSEARAHALQGLQEIYRRAGFERTGGELPDYLPLILEFLSVAPEQSKREVLGVIGDSLAALAGRLRRDQNPYADGMDHLIEVLGLDSLDADAGKASAALVEASESD
jgi:nitrate reductase molybdenum cofactor assembly chaperone NarJ/NarW